MSKVNHDARGRLWAVATPPDMLTKLGWEMSTLFDALKQKDVRIAAYFALNGCLTACHMTDWLLATLDSEARLGDAQRVLKAITESEIRKAVISVPAIAACHQIANAAKHVFLSEERSYRPGYHASHEDVSSDESDSLHGLWIETPHGKEEIVWTLYRAYEWWANTLRALNYTVEANTPIVSLKS